MNKSLDFFDEIFRDLDGFCEFRSFPPDGSRAYQTFHALPIKKLPALDATRGQYFGPAPRTCKRGRDEDVNYSGVLWADVDAKAFDEGKHQALELLSNYGPLTPSVIVDSGHGYHAYWLLVEPIDAGDMRPLMEALRYSVNPGLDKVDNPSRILRVPGTKNLKDDPPLPVKIVHWEPDRRFSEEKLGEILNVGGAKQRLQKPVSSKSLPQEQLDDVDPVQLALSVTIPEGGGDTVFGGRNEAAAKVAGYYLNIMSRPAARSSFFSWSQTHCDPPLPDDEAEKVFQSIAKRDALQTGEETHPNTGDETQDREIMLTSLSEKFGISIDDIVRVEGSDPLYRFYLDGQSVEIRAKDIVSQRKWRQAIVALTERVPRKIGRNANPGWDHFLQLMLDVAKTIEPGEEAYDRGQLKAWVQKYLETKHHIEEAREPTELLEQPCTVDGDIYLHLQDLRRDIEMEFGVKKDARKLAQQLRVEGFERKNVNRRTTSDEWTTRSMWQVPPEILEE